MARRPRTDEPADETQGKRKRRAAAPPSNVTDETIREMCGKALGAKAELEAKEAEAKSAKGAYRAVLKAAKAVGIDPDHIRWYLDARKQDVKEIDRATAWRNRIARVMGLPIGTQLGLFDDGETVAAKVDGDFIASGGEDHTLAQAEDEGRDAFAGGEPLSANPYKLGSPHCGRWNTGWTLAHDLANPGQASVEAVADPEMAGAPG